MAVSPVILAVTPAAEALASRLRKILPEAEFHGLQGRVAAETEFSDTILHLRDLFTAGRPIIGICAAGILIRALAPLLAQKKEEPPVLAVSVDGASVVPLLGGHNGANALARKLATALSAHAAITTAGDLTLGVALDEPPQGWRIANPAAAKRIMAALLAGEAVSLHDETQSGDWLKSIAFQDGAKLSVRITARAVAGSENELVLHPPVLALGVGCERNAPPEDLRALALETLQQAGLSPLAIACVASIDLKADEAAVHDLARHLGVAARFFTPEQLEDQTPRLANPSDIVFAETGCHGVAEGAALAIAGAQGNLLQPKRKTKRSTCAIAQSPTPIRADQHGRARGRLAIVGIGPGNDEWRTPEVTLAIAKAQDLVGYGLYLDLLGDLALGKTRHESGLGSEEARARMALDLAAQGRDVALVCSGDAGIYALATLVFELLDVGQRPDWNRIAVTVCPGVSAIQAAAARAGAPINHDFCTISLSDLLTPWDVIETRLHAAAKGDFVVAFYNPVSQRRRDQLVKARDILLTGRPGDTPVILARNLGREGETLEIIPLAELTADRADMLTLVLVGSSDSRILHLAERAWVYTPRGYAKKRAQPA